MTIANQLGGLPVTGGDTVFKNYGGTAIAAGKAVIFDAANVGDANNPPGVVLPTAAGGVALTCGVTLEIIPAGGLGRVRMLGGAVGTANGTLHPGTLVKIDDAAGQLGNINVATSTAEILGKALSDAVAGDPVLVWVNPTAHN